ncbi:MAG: glycoside hydrolase family 172 protein [Planctomycetota bacterium]
MDYIDRRCGRFGYLSIIGGAAFCFLCSRVVFADSMAELARPHEGRSMRATSTHKIGPDGKSDPNGVPDPNSNRDNSSVAPGQRKILLDVKGPGVITHIWMTFLGPSPHPWARNGSANHQEMLLRMYWDGSERPAVEAPVGDFFANSFGKRSEVISLPVIVEDADSYNCFWHMPFRKSARMEVLNQSDKPISLLYYNIDWVRKEQISEQTPYFYAQYRQEYPVENGKDYVVLDTQGKGHYVGTVLNVRTRSPAWFGEGDEKIYIDGEEKASIWGTGTEDYFLSAWGLKTTGTPYFGVPYFDQWGIVGGHTSAYRWHVTDPLVFSKAIKVTFEHYGWMSPDENPQYKSHSWNEREDDYSSVAFWYQTGAPTFDARAPHARQRKLPSLDRIIRAREFTAERYHGRGEALVQNLDIYTDGHLFYKPQMQEDAWIEIPFEVEKKEPQRLLLLMTRSYDYGKYQAYLNGVKLGGVVDLYSKEVVTREYHLLDFWPAPGKYKLRLECVGRNTASAGHYLGIESVRLRRRRPRVSQYRHDVEKDWRKNPILYK